MVNFTGKIFLSYSWNDFEVANQLDNYFMQLGIKLIRDIRDVEYRQNLKEFIKSIRSCDFVIMLISDSYLRSFNCMTEVIEAIKEVSYSQKIIHVILGNLDINSPKSRINYTNFWKESSDQFEESLKILNESTKLPHIEDLRKYRKIEFEIGSFLQEVSNFKYLTFKQLKEQNFIPILEIVDKQNISSYKAIINNLKIKDNTKRKNNLNSIKIILPDWPNISFMLGTFELVKGNYFDSLKYFDEALRLNKEFIAALINKSHALNQLGLFNEAIDCNNIVLSIDDKVVDAYYNKGVNYLAIGNFEKANEDLSHAINLNPKDHEAYNNRGLSFIKLKLFEDSIKDFNRAIDIFPQKASAYNNRGIAYRKLELPYNALRDYSHAIRLNSNYADAYFNRGLLKLVLNDLENAKMDLIKASELGNSKALEIYSQFIK